MKYAFITGVSKGLGESIAKLFLESGVRVIGLSRTTNGTIARCAEENNNIFIHYTCDLSDSLAIQKTCKDVMVQLSNSDVSALYIINNGAVLEPIDQSMLIDPNDLIHHVQVNTIAPMLILNYFLNKTQDLDIPLIGVNVTSGAAEDPFYGWSAYCSSKASINMYTKTVALEQDTLKTGNKVIAFSPGIMNTDMQEQIRTTSTTAFADVETFRNYHKNDLLKDTDEVGGILIDIITDDSNLENGKVYSVKDYL